MDFILSYFLSLTIYLISYSNPVFSVGIIDAFKTWLHEKIQSVINYIRDIFFDVFKSITDFLKAMLLTALDMLKDLFYFIFDALMSLMVALLSGLGSLFSALNFTNALDGMPSEVLNIIGLVGLGQCMAFIVTALIIRITLQLIPFTRLGS
ncbi:MAG: DUF2523 family protein [Agitococcus sp.]|nr:DUF2523 family protein [Agitococcus sp.]